VDHSRSERTTPNCTITDLIHLADLTPRDTLIPLDALGLAAQACLLPQSHLADHILLDALNQAALVYLHRLWDPSFLVDLSRSVMRSSNTTDLTHLADLIHLADPTHLASLTHLAGRTRLGRLFHRLCPPVFLIPSLMARLLFDPITLFGDAETYGRFFLVVEEMLTIPSFYTNTFNPIT
jgi:hypothetical protein